MKQYPKHEYVFIGHHALFTLILVKTKFDIYSKNVYFNEMLKFQVEIISLNLLVHYTKSKLKPYTGQTVEHTDSKT